METRERQMIDSARMRRLISKASKKYGVLFKKPEFRPVFFSKRIKKNWGYYDGGGIRLSQNIYDSKYAREHTLWHEIIHAFVSDNLPLLCESRPRETWTALHGSFEREIFRMATNDGSHGSWNWKVSCECGYWWKSLKKRHEMFCPRCNVYLVSATELKKLKKIATIGSRKFQIDISKYKPWESNEKMRD